MLTNKKELREIRDSIKELENKLEEQSKNNNKEISENIIKLSDKIIDLESNNSLLTKKFELELNNFITLNELLKRKIGTLEVVEKKIIGVTTDIAKNEINNQLSSLKILGNKYHELENTLLKTNNTIGSLREDVLEFKKASMQIKNMDFSLVTYTKEINKFNTEKSRLLDENEKLKKLVAKDRRKY